MSWDESEKAAQQMGDYVSLKNDGDTMVLAFLGEPKPVEVDFKGEKSTKFRFAVMPEGGTKSKSLDVSKTTLEGIKKNKAQTGTHWFRMTRHGAAGDTKTVYSFEPVHALTAEDLKRFAEPVPAPAAGASASGVPF